jgi:hypothetical protein
MKTAALAPILAAACVSAVAPALAAPALPGGWVAGKPGLHDAAPAFPTMTATPPRPNRPWLSRRLDIDALPVVAVEKARPAGEIPAALPTGSPADVVVVKNDSARLINVAGFTAGVLFVDRSVAFFGRGGIGGIAGACGSGAKGRPIKPIRYEGVRRVGPENALELVVGRGLLETSTCRVAINERYSARPAKLAGGLVLGFRTRCDACAEGAREMLHVLTPQLTNSLDMIVPFEHHTLSLEKGTSRIVEGFPNTTFSLSFKAPNWSDFSDRTCKEAGEGCRGGVRIEVSRGETEAKATVLVKPNTDE